MPAAQRPTRGWRRSGRLGKLDRVLSVAVRLQPSEWLLAWREDTARLRLSVPSALRLRERVAVRIQLSGHSVSATVLGTVVSVQRHESDRRVELAPDPESLGAVRLLVAAARGEPVRFLQRTPRYLVTLPAVVSCDGLDLYMTASCISAGGCALRWSGPDPIVGRVLGLRLGAGSRTADLQGVVRWRTRFTSSWTVGVRFVDGSRARGHWEGFLTEAAKSGAPRA
jgi:hypothetical protein